MAAENFSVRLSGPASALRVSSSPVVVAGLAVATVPETVDTTAPRPRYRPQRIAVPRGVPRAVIDRANAAMREAAEEPAMQERFLQTGARVMWTTPEDAAARAARERPMWREVVRLSGARLE